ncbi:MAG: hypothetical protein II644_06140 [Paludibacteraceae bacterium]|nr:hypothetical protein [Paludibacteraceae bacterium]
MGDPKRKLTDIIDYIITWLCYGDEEAAARVAYTNDEKALADHDVLIIPNGRLGNSIVLPEMDKVIVERPEKGKAIIRTDIVYNTFFFISRAEETFNTERDEHDRFIARYSILGHISRMQMPMLDEHARLLLKLLNCPLPSPGFNHIYLTHDIDTISQYRSIRGALGGIKRGETKQVWAALRDIHNDPMYTFPWLIDHDATVPNAETIYFVKHTAGRGYDYPQYRLLGRDYKRLKKLLRHSNAYLGIHGSYYGFIPKIKYSRMYRAHYLRESIRQMEHLHKAGYTDDFTMGFADQAGFRLQTTRAVRWINPMTMRLTNLTLHPLIIMDTTLSNKKYMNLTEDEAYFLCERLIDKVKMHHGDLCLLWHNSNLTDDTYHKSLYTKILKLLQ